MLNVILLSIGLLNVMAPTRHVRHKEERHIKYESTQAKTVTQS